HEGGGGREAEAARLGDDGRGQVTTGGVAHDHDLGGRNALVEQPAVRVEAVLEGSGERVLGGEAVVGHQDGQSGVGREPAGDRAVGARRAGGEPSAVQVQDGTVPRLGREDPFSGEQTVRLVRQVVQLDAGDGRV